MSSYNDTYYKPGWTDRVMDNGWLFAGSLVVSVVGLMLTMVAVVAPIVIVVGEKNCARTGQHLGVESVYDRFQGQCYLTVNGQKIPADKYFVNQPVQK